MITTNVTLTEPQVTAIATMMTRFGGATSSIYGMAALAQQAEIGCDDLAALSLATDDQGQVTASLESMDGLRDALAVVQEWVEEASCAINTALGRLSAGAR